MPVGLYKYYSRQVSVRRVEIVKQENSQSRMNASGTGKLKAPSSKSCPWSKEAVQCHFKLKVYSAALNTLIHSTRHSSGGHKLEACGHGTDANACETHT